jgi:hypothetical protein
MLLGFFLFWVCQPTTHIQFSSFFLAQYWPIFISYFLELACASREKRKFWEETPIREKTKNP